MEKFWQYIKNILGADVQPSAAQPTEIKYPFFRIILDPYALTLDRFVSFLKVAASVAALLTLIYMVGGQTVYCWLDAYFQNGGYCNGNIIAFSLVHLLAFALIGVFASRWYGIAFKEQKMSWRWLLPDKKDIKVFAVLVVFVLLNALSFLSYYLLAVRIPNPDWRIELAYFAIVSLGFLVPFILMRFYALLAFILGGEPLPPLKTVWRRSAGNGMRTILSLFLFFLVSIFSVSAYSQSLRTSEWGYNFYIVFSGEYFFNLISLLLMSFFVNLCYLQKKFLFGEDEHGTDR